GKQVHETGRQGLVAYEWGDFSKICADCGLAAATLPWHHPRQQWFVAVPSVRKRELSILQQRARSSLRPTPTRVLASRHSVELVPRRLRRTARSARQAGTAHLKRWTSR